MLSINTLVSGATREMKNGAEKIHLPQTLLLLILNNSMSKLRKNLKLNIKENYI